MNLIYNFENISLWFQGGVRRGFFVFGLAGLILAIPLFFITTFLSGLWFETNINPFGIDRTVNFQQKVVPIKEIIISNSQIAPLKDGSSELYLSINNKSNPEVGFFPFIYELVVTDKNNAVIDQSTAETYLLPGELKYIVYRSKDSNAANLKIRKSDNTNQVYFNPNSKKFKKPNIQITNIKFAERTLTNILNISFTIRNNDNVSIKETDLIYSIRDSRESVVGIGDFKIQDLIAGEERDISIVYTQPAERIAKFIDIDWYVNYLNEGILY